MRPTRPRSVTALLSMAAVAVLLGGCATDSGSAPTPSTPSDTPTSDGPADGLADGPSVRIPRFPKNTAPQFRRSSSRALLVFTDIRTAQHQGFDRIVLDFSGKGTPGWAVNYVDQAVLDGSGQVVRMDGDAFLDIYASGTTAPAPGYYDGPRRIEPRASGISEVFVSGTFEGTTQLLAGIDDSRTPFRVFTLAGPTRLVIDIAHQSAR